MTVSLLSKLSPKALGLFKTGGLAGGLGLSAYVAKPFVLAEQHYFADAAGRDSVSPELKVQVTAQRRQNFENMIFNRYVKQGTGKINWYQMADIVDYIARNTPSDDDFRKDIWHLFGWREGQVRAPLANYLDAGNLGLPDSLKNTGYESEQMHHYLGATTGNTSPIPSHLQNNRLYAYAYELLELSKRGHYNWGDVRLFNVAQKHRDDFLRNGRFVVADNMRRMLQPMPATAPMPQASWGSVPSQAS